MHSTPTELRVIALESQGSNFDQISISNCTPDQPALPKAILTLAKRIEHVRYMMQGTLELKILQWKRSETLALLNRFLGWLANSPKYLPSTCLSVRKCPDRYLR